MILKNVKLPIRTPKFQQQNKTIQLNKKIFNIIQNVFRISLKLSKNQQPKHTYCDCGDEHTVFVLWH